MTNKRGSVRVTLEVTLLLIYAWNSSSIPGINLSRSLVAIGHEFTFPVDFSAAKHLKFTSSPSIVKIKTYTRTQAKLMEASQELDTVLLEEHQEYHRELINAR